MVCSRFCISLIWLSGGVWKTKQKWKGAFVFVDDDDDENR